MTGLKAKLAAAVEANQEGGEDLGEMEDRLSSAAAELRAAKQSLADMEAANAELTRNLKSAQSEASASSRTVEEEESRISELSASVRSAQEERDALAAQLEPLKASAQESASELDSVRAERDDLAQQMKDALQRVIILEREASDAAGAGSSAQAALKEVSGERDDLRSQITILTQKLESADRDVQAADRDVQAEAAQISSLTEERDSLLQRFQVLQGSFDKLQSESRSEEGANDKLNADLRAKDERILQLEQRLASTASSAAAGAHEEKGGCCGGDYVMQVEFQMNEESGVCEPITQRVQWMQRQATDTMKSQTEGDPCLVSLVSSSVSDKAEKHPRKERVFASSGAAKYDDHATVLASGEDEDFQEFLAVRGLDALHARLLKAQIASRSDLLLYRSKDELVEDLKDEGFKRPEITRLWWKAIQNQK